MGIKGFKRDVLLDAVTPDVLVKDIVQKHRITRIIVDFSGLLHAALRPAAEDVVDESNEHALMGLLDSFYSKISFLRDAGMEHLHFVRDGATTPAKAKYILPGPFKTAPAPCRAGRRRSTAW